MKTISALLLSSFIIATSFSQSIPLPEHPNPIKKRDQWINLNGYWEFAFDSLDIGIDGNWATGDKKFDKTILVPFPWGSGLSEVSDDADIGWYKRTITVPADWEERRVFIIIGASDWETHVWLDGKFLGSHQGGYVPFEFELTPHIRFDQEMTLVVRVDDTYRQHMLYGKQGYGNARGIWQTVYLETRGEEYIEDIHFTPDIDAGKVQVTAYLPEYVSEERTLDISINGPQGRIDGQVTVWPGQSESRTSIEIDDLRLWTLEDPYLYEVEVVYGDDKLESYFGMRKIGVVNLPGTDIPYVALNNEPIYLQMALDQSYHPDGFYTFPDDQFMIDEINRSKSIGLNGIRTHIKVEVPRKLYWADKLGLLVMEDLPNSWGDPDDEMQKESTYTLREMIKRDYNHPSIFSWVIINETWGMRTTTENGREYLPETQEWLVSMYHLAKSLDPTRLVEDNSICCGVGHTVTDINSWHIYLPGYAWDEYLSNLSDSTFVGSGFNYEDGYQQRGEPNFNSECGNVWGYDGSAGDVDWSWDYHRMINSFRKYPKIGGWLYTEHHDVINEWNGYWRFDRTEKYTGFEDIVPDMNLNDLHSSIYLSTGQDICFPAKAGETIDIPIYLSVMTSKEYPEGLVFEYGISSVNSVGEEREYSQLATREISYSPWLQKELDPITISAPEMDGLSTIHLLLQTKSGEVLHRNFIHVVTTGGQENQAVKVTSVDPANYSDSDWSTKTWDVLEGKKVNGAGNGYFEYSFALEDDLDLNNLKEAYFIIEVSAKELFVKDQEEYQRNQDFMRGSIVAPSSNPNSYPMSDETMYPSEVIIYANGQKLHSQMLPDDPADHRGVLSWFAQPQDRKLREAGSYGYMVRVPIEKSMIEDRTLKVRLEVTDNGGLAVYGKEFGRYPFDPSLVLKY